VVALLHSAGLQHKGPHRGPRLLIWRGNQPQRLTLSPPLSSDHDLEASTDPDFEAKKKRILQLYGLMDGTDEVLDGDPEAVLVIDETGDLKKGITTVGMRASTVEISCARSTSTGARRPQAPRVIEDGPRPRRPTPASSWPTLRSTTAPPAVSRRSSSLTDSRRAVRRIDFRPCVVSASPLARLPFVQAGEP
jgi:hypothetical protein